MVREELAKYLNSRPCPECDGTRLRREARYVGRRRRRRARDLRDLGGAAARGGGVFRAAEARRPARGDRRQDRQGDRLAARVPQQRRPRLPVARPLGRDAVRRRGAAHPARVADRLGPDRRHVRARRAVDRPAPARQRPPARHAEAPARPRQHRHRRRARPGRDPGGRLRRRHGPGRRRARRPGRRAGHAGRDAPRAALADRPVPLRATGRSRSPRAGIAATRRTRW